ncbi:response regulator [bacterium]|nr:response regulator [bacterium]
MRGNILVVDDEGGPRESLRMILKMDHDVRTAESGPIALAEIARQKPDLVFLDISMPDMPGTEVLRQVKEQWPDVEVAIITAHAAVDSARLAVRFGALDYLTKPYSIADVTRIVDRALSARRQQHDSDVLSAQLAKMAETLGGWARSLDADRSDGIAHAVDSLRSVQSSLPEDLESMRKLSELGEVTAEVTHDINNLLTVILTNSQFLLMQLEGQVEAEVSPKDPPAVASRVSRIVRAAEDCSMIIRRVKDFVRANVSHPAVTLNVNDLVSSAVDLKRDVNGESDRQVEYVMRLRPVPKIQGDEIALRTVIVNLIENSLDAVGKEGTIELSTELRDGFVRIQIRDDGCGMSPEVLENAKGAFFSANKPQGTGLGLSTADRVARAHQGRLEIDSAEGVGTTICLLIPPVNAQPEAAPTMDTAETRPEGSQAVTAPAATPENPKGIILLVDDEEGIRELMAAVLETDGYRVLQAPDGRQGWEMFQREHHRADDLPLVVVTDHEMPQLTGRELSLLVKRLDPTVPVLIVSGYITEHTGPEDAVLGKPFDLQEFLECVRGLRAADTVDD